MTDEEKELLARIGDLAGRINRHRSQQNDTRPTPSHPSRPQHHYAGYRHRTAPYPTHGYRSNRQRPHQHRTLHMNASSTQAENGSAETGRWVAKNDRHRQLINANVYEKETQTRNKAIEETRTKKQGQQQRAEKARFNEFLSDQVSTAPTNHKVATTRDEITVKDIRFRVVDGGKKLVKISDGGNASLPTPKTAVIAGITFHRTKTGNLVVNRIVKEHRRSGVVKKINEPCKIFSTTGSCPKGPRCRYMHDPEKVAICKDFLKEGKCPLGDSCDLSHDLSPERVPDCLHYAKGHCAKADCPYTHSKAPAGAPVCRDFALRGYCPRGAQCMERHVYECPDFSNTGKCLTKGCKLPHRERASVLRGQAKAAKAAEDVSSDEEAADSDDIDSDDVAEFIEADSDASDVEDYQNFIAV